MPDSRRYPQSQGSIFSLKLPPPLSFESIFFPRRLYVCAEGFYWLNWGK